MARALQEYAEVLLEGFLALDTPDGFRAELIEGEIVVSPLPDGDHEHRLGLIMNQVVRRSVTDMQLSGHKGLTVRHGGADPSHHMIPDLTLAPQAHKLFRGAAPWMPCEGVEMAVEVTGRKPERDRGAKRRCYATGGIPHYLLVDAERSAVTLFGTPERDDYRQLLTHPFGNSMPLPAPFSFDLGTSEFG